MFAVNSRKCTVFLLINLSCSVLTSVCPYGWRDYPGSPSCYLITDYQVRYTFSEALDRCQGFESSLIMFDSQAELDWLTKELKQIGWLPPKMGWWIGMVNSDKGVKYVNGSETNIQLPWEGGTQPTPSLNQLCAYLVNDTIQFNTCNSWLGFVCQRSKDLPFSCDIEDQWMAINGSCIKYFYTSQSWFAAQDTCLRHDGVLAKPTTLQQMAYIWDQAKLSSKMSWIGLKSNHLTNKYEWTDGSPLDSSMQWWSDKQPLNISSTDTCGYINGTSRRLGSWGTENCSTSYTFTCMKPSGQCADGWLPHMGSCVKFYTTLNLPWLPARSFCFSMGAELLKISSESYQSFINSYLYELKVASIHQMWIGLSDASDDKTYMWSDGSAIGNFSNWAEASPSNRVGKLDAAFIDTGDTSGKWQIGDPSTRMSFGCMISNTKALKQIITDNPSYQCEPMWEVAGDTCIYISDLDTNWTQAQIHCINMQAQLVVLNSREAQIYLDNRIKTGNYWIGLEDRNSDGKFTWLNGTKLNASSWDVSQPSNKSGDDCVLVRPVVLGTLWSQVGAKWSAVNCQDKASFICQKAPSTAPATGLGTTQVPYSVKCGQMWEERPGTDFCYQFREVTLNWFDALEVCKYHNGSLASVVSQEEQAYLEGRIGKRDVVAFWIGATDKNQEAGWSWEDSAPFSFINWDKGEPNDFQGEDCVGIKTSNMKWNDFSCTLKNAFICKKQVNTATRTSVQTTTPTLAGTYYGCAHGWLGYNNNCYLLKWSSSTWMDAQLSCRQENAELASIASLSENSFLWSRLPKEECRNQHPNSSECDVWANQGECQSNYAWMSVHCTMSCDLCDNICADKYTSFQCQYWSRIGECSKNPNWMLPNCALSCGCDKSMNKGFWIGLNDRQRPLSFEWTDLAGVVYTNWYFNEPNNFYGKLEDCVMIHSSNGKWSDELCDVEATGFVCKRPMVVSDLVTLSPDQIGCPLGGFGYGASCYELINDQKTWSEALSFCQSSNGTLATVQNSITGAFITSELVGKLSSHWIGLLNLNGKYTWANGAALEYTDWAPTHTGNENNTCVAVRPQRPIGLWEDLECQLKQPFICEVHRKGFIPQTRQQTTELPTQSHTQQTTELPPQSHTQQTTQLNCPLPWKGKGDYCFQMFYDLKTWMEAQSHCEVFGGSLPSLHDDGTLTFLTNTVMNRFSVNSGFWIGLSDRTKESSFEWIDGSPFDFSKWDNGEPNGFTSSEDCVEVNSVTRKWNDNNCFTSKPFVCSIRSGVPLPSAPPTQPTTPARCVDLSWSFYNGSCYYISPVYGPESRLSWFSARRKCHSLGADLVSIVSQDENDFLTTLISKVQSTQFWIGLNQLEQDAYVWSDASPAVFVSWAKNEPNDAFGGERCVDISGYHGNWIDDNCMNEYNYICKKLNDTSHVVITPTPAPVDTGACPDQFTSIGTSNKCFYIGGLGNESGKDPKLSWSDARGACRNISWLYRVDIASISNQLDQDYASVLMSHQTSDMWIGLQDLAKMNTYTWQDNSEPTFINWASGEPGYHYSNWGAENCVHMVRSPLKIEDLAKWKNDQCDKKKAFLCQTTKASSQTSTTTPQESNNCPKDFEEHMNACFSFVNIPTSWDDARKQCHAMAADLASTLDIFEVAMLNIIQDKRNVHQQAWIGLKYDQTTSQFTWSDQWPVTTSFWAPSNPDLQINNSCVALSSSKWNDTYCNELLPFFCETRRDLPPSPTPTPAGHCADQKHIHFGDFCYLIRLEESLSWPEAAYTCGQMGMQLVSIHSSDELEFLRQQINILKETKTGWGSYSLQKNLWIGLSRDLSGTYSWSDQSATEYLNWASGEPSLRVSSLSQTTEEECVEMYQDSGQWNDLACVGNRIGYICKTKQILPTTVPSTTLSTPSTPSTLPTASKSPTQPDSMTTRTSVSWKNFYLPAVQHHPDVSNRLTGGQIAGIVIGIMGFCVIIVAVAVVVRKKTLPTRCLRNLIGQGSGYENALYKCGEERKDNIQLGLSTES
ncbi:macrophage mannose receptor 1-like isoform X2 [Physella acuta]|uniref:macrophage mannose receptor 1-like isoform X2 n=1 Tax=Physella acuta TaxID=109671 RepID=UPI0027DB5A6A|nr:macrophage mannose receptor 1-like isoform X2 [Physella acuta]